MNAPWFIYVDRNVVACNRELAADCKLPPIAVMSFNDDGTRDVRHANKVKVDGVLHHDCDGRFIPEYASVVFVQEKEPEILA